MREMTKDGFWELIEAAKDLFGHDMDASVEWLKAQLMERGPQQAQDFHDILHSYQQLADQYGLWSAASILCDGCTDDGFIDFRAWLIAQGKEVYMAALRDPDSLADVGSYGGCQFEFLSYVGSKALEALTGHSAYENDDIASWDALTAELEQDVVYGTGIGYPYQQNEIAAYLPRLCAKYLTAEELAFMAEYEDDSWNLGNENIRNARAAGPQDAPVRRPWADEPTSQADEQQDALTITMEGMGW